LYVLEQFQPYGDLTMNESAISRMRRECRKNLSGRGWSESIAVAGDIVVLTFVRVDGKHVVFAADLEDYCAGRENIVLQHDGDLDLSPAVELSR
jgi:hypothetical protein